MTDTTNTSELLLDALLEIKLLAQKHDDSGYEPYTLLELIEQKALAALANTNGADRSEPALLAALEQALAALNTVPRFKVPSLDTDSYKIAALCDRALAKAKAKGAGQ